jgi:nucleotide-binding universal stress UspA family protein
MQKLFNKILIPVDFSSKSKSVVAKAVNLAKLYECDIHLLHVITISPFDAIASAEGHMFIPYNAMSNHEELKRQLEKLCDEIRVMSDYSLKISYSLLKGLWEDTLVGLTRRRKIDLILIGQREKSGSKRKMLLNPDKIAERTKVPVITIPANRRMTKLYSILIPITDFFPIRKLVYGIHIASVYHTTIKLLGIESHDTKEVVANNLDRAVSFLRDYYHITVEIDTVCNENIAQAVNEFANREAADLVIVNPDTQTKMPGFLSSIFGNIIQKFSVPPVLTITRF